MESAFPLGQAGEAEGSICTLHGWYLLQHVGSPGWAGLGWAGGQGWAPGSQILPQQQQQLGAFLLLPRQPNCER